MRYLSAMEARAQTLRVWALFCYKEWEVSLQDKYYFNAQITLISLIIN